ncbi:hypothetical protein ACH3XW_29060 [Acanthocheilonema viteae]
MCNLCLKEMVGIIHDLNDSKATVLAKIDENCKAIFGTNMEWYRTCVIATSKIYLKLADNTEKQFNPNNFCKKIHMCPKYL